MNRPPPPTVLFLNLAPMVDVMMCLLIFFMLATKLVEQEHSRIDLPVAAAAKDTERSQLGNRFVVNIRRAPPNSADSAIYLIREQALPLDEVLDHLEREGRIDPSVNCVIRADRTVPYKDVEAIMLRCAQCGIRNLTFSALRGQPGDTG